MTIVTIDFEASCLPRHGRSFPIELGVADEQGARSWLIRPEPEWLDWDWTAEAQGLHGLSLDRIVSDGQPAATIWPELMGIVGDRRIVSDSAIDNHWFALFARAARATRAPAIDHIGTLFDQWGATHGAIVAAVAHADGAVPSRHRAGADALWLAKVVHHLDPNRAPDDGMFMIAPPPCAFPAAATIRHVQPT